MFGLVERFNSFIEGLVEITRKDEDPAEIQMRAVFSLYEILGMVIHFLFVVIMVTYGIIIDGMGMQARPWMFVATFELVYALVLLVLKTVYQRASLKFISNCLIISSALLCFPYALLLGSNYKYDLYIFLLIPMMVSLLHKNQKWYLPVMAVVMVGGFTFVNYCYVFREPVLNIDNKWIEFTFAMLNSIEIFFKSYFYVVLISRYSEHTIERLREDKKILDKDSKIDHLTGLYNRRSMEKFLSILEEQYKITNKPFGLILMDIDFFKKVNDTYGHQAGDKVLVEISRLIVYTLRKSDEVFRYGGEEILAVVPGIQTKEDVIKVANQIRSDVESLKIPNGEEDISVTISCGCTIFDGQEMEATIKRVDEALYMSKNNGRNRVEYL